ncbi:hypothetical protein J132_03936, partial [Termitomyces sp. J132]
GTLKVWQLNMNKLLMAQHTALCVLGDNIDIVCIQELYFDFNKKLRATQLWWPVYPKGHDEKDIDRTRALMLMSRRIVTNTWRRVDIKSTDMVGISIKMGERTVRVFNVYNNGEHSRSTHALNFYLRSMQEQRQRGRNEADIWVGDFNCYHSMWEDPRNSHLFTRRNLDAVEELIAMLTRHRMIMALWLGMPTLESMSTKNLMRPNNVFITHSLREQVMRCKVLRSKTPLNTNHFLIVMELGLETEASREEGGRNFKKVDWREFEEELGRQLEGIPTERIERREEVEEWLEGVMEVLRRTVEAIVPERQMSTFAKRWWSKELREMRVKTKALGRALDKVIHIEGHQVHEEYR